MMVDAVNENVKEPDDEEEDEEDEDETEDGSMFETVFELEHENRHPGANLRWVGKITDQIHVEMVSVLFFFFNKPRLSESTRHVNMPKCCPGCQLVMFHTVRPEIRQ